MSFNLRTPHVNVSNAREYVYLKGDANTDGSLRIVPDQTVQENFEFQYRNNGVWNDTGIQISSATIFLGRDLEVKSAGDWILTTDVQKTHRALAPHIEFTDEEGTLEYAHLPILGALQADVPVQPDFSEEIITSSYSDTQTNPSDLLAQTIGMKTGSVAATEPVTISFLRPSDTVFWTRNYPASHFPANSDITIDLLGLLEAFEGEQISTTITSDAPFSFLGDSGGEAYTLLSYFDFSEESLVTFETGIDKILTSYITHDTMVDVDGNLMTIGAGEHH
tara:strand:+ start:935 stop:1768 length:834 start_codon:yes stop_codon:yes gene_type:complete